MPKTSKKTDMQQIVAAEPSKKELKTPASYTQVRSNVGKSDLLSAVGFQKHFNMPLQLKPSRQQDGSKAQAP